MYFYYNTHQRLECEWICHIAINNFNKVCPFCDFVMKTQLWNFFFSARWPWAETRMVPGWNPSDKPSEIKILDIPMLSMVVTVWEWLSSKTLSETTGAQESWKSWYVGSYIIYIILNTIFPWKSQCMCLFKISAKRGALFRKRVPNWGVDY